MAKVFIGLPMTGDGGNSGWIHHSVAESLLRIMNDRLSNDMMIQFVAGKPLENTRNLIVRSFLESGFDYLLMIDSDNPPIRNPLELISLDKDIVILPTPIWNDKIVKEGRGHVPLRWNTYGTYDEAHKGWVENMKCSGLHEIEAGGTGCILIARRVLEAVRPAFCREFDESGCDFKGSDLLFCHRAKKAGFSIWCHYDYPCRHHKEVDLLDVHNTLVFRDISFASSENINTPEYWDEEWKKRSSRILPTYERIVTLLQDKPRVLDYGCGRGDLLAMLGPEAEGIDISSKAVDICRERGLRAHHYNPDLNQTCQLPPLGPWDAIVATQVLEHVDDDAGLVRELQAMAPLLIYTVPHDCLPPGMEPEHRRVYSADYVRKITPNIKAIEEIDDYLLVVAERESAS